MMAAGLVEGGERGKVGGWCGTPATPPANFSGSLQAGAEGGTRDSEVSLAAHHSDERFVSFSPFWALWRAWSSGGSALRWVRGSETGPLFAAPSDDG